MYKFIFVLFSFCFLHAQETSIPYDDSFGIPIIDISIKGENHKFLFDTGAYKTGINSEIFTSLPILDSTDVNDANNITKSMKLTSFSFNFLDKNYTDLKVLYLNLNILSKISNCENIVLSGIIGRDIMENYIVEINPSLKKIIFHNPANIQKSKLSDFTKIKFKSNYQRPVIPIKIGGQKRYVIYDTGNNGKLSISDYKLKNYISTTDHTAYISQGNKFAAHGVNENKDLNHTIYNAEIHIGKLNVKNQIVETSRNDINNMGFSFIDQFISYLDVKGETLYLKQINKNYFGESSLKNLGFYLRYDEEQNKNLIVNLSTKNEKLKLGDNLISINGETPPENNCEMHSFLKKFFGIPVKIKIERENKIIEIEQKAEGKKLLVNT